MLSNHYFIYIGHTKILVGMGVGQSGHLNNIEIVDLKSSSTTCKGLANFPRSAEGAIGGLNTNQRPIICGGYNSSFISDCSFYKDGVWNLFPFLNTPRGNAAAFSFPYPNGALSLFVTGGLDNFWSLNTMEVLIDDGWQKLPSSIPATIDGHCMVHINFTTVLIIGGHQNGTASPNTFYYNTENGDWDDGPRLLSSRYDHSCGKLQRDSLSSKDSIIVAGGVNGTFLSSVEILNVGSSNWRTGPKLPFGILGASMIEHPSGGVVLVGGYNGSNLDTLYHLPHASSEWVLMPQKLKAARRYATAFLVPDEITSCV